MDWLQISTIIVAAGVFGGIVNFALQGRGVRETTGAGKDLFYAIVAGVGASALVPLFLNTLESELLSNILSGSAKNTGSEFVFAGFCLLAAISSRAFISSLTDRVLRDTQGRVEELERRETEDHDALQLVDVQLGETSKPPFAEATLTESIKSASPVTQETIYHLAKSTRSEAFGALKRVMDAQYDDPAVKDNDLKHAQRWMSRTIPIFRALAETSKGNDWHRCYAQLGYSLKDVGRNAEARTALERALAISSGNTDSDSALYWYNWAICRIRLDNEERGAGETKTPVEVGDRIRNGLRIGSTLPKLASAAHTDADVAEWLQRNSISLAAALAD
jgi:tetratricopeptide (TPR) repeat protein